MENKITMVKLKQNTVQALKDLKIVERESYDEVINRMIIKCVAEDELKLNDDTKKLLTSRIKNLNEGKTMSFNEMLNSFKERKEVTHGGKEEEGSKKNPRSKNGVTVGS